MAQFIFTADDAGCLPDIDDAILDLIFGKRRDNLPDSNRLSSIEVFANGPNIDNLSTALHGNYAKVDIGCHLTITSGSPTKAELIKDPHFKHFIVCKEGKEDSLSPGDYIFNRFVDQRRIGGNNPNTKEKITLALKKEINNQVDIVNSKFGNKVTHLSSHHDALTFFPEYYDAMIEVADERKLKIRSPFIRPKPREWFFYFQIRFRSLSDLSKEDRKELRKFVKGREGWINTKKNELNNPLWYPLYTYGVHYGPIPPTNLFAENNSSHRGNVDFDKKFNSYADRKRNKTIKKIKKLNKKEASFAKIEIPLHVIKANSADELKNKIPQLKRMMEDPDGEFYYPGVNSGYFDSRYLEYLSMLHFENKEYKTNW